MYKRQIYNLKKTKKKGTLQIGKFLVFYAETECYVKRRQHGLRARFFMAGILGFEPRMPDSESGALPLGDIPIYWSETDFIESSLFCKRFYSIILLVVKVDDRSI